MEKEDLLKVSKQQALKHPNWEMGATIDSASLMNKGLEVIEAKWLFGLKSEEIDVIVHPQSIIHYRSVQRGSMKAQMGLPYEATYTIRFSIPPRIPSDFPRFNFMNYPNLI